MAATGGERDIIKLCLPPVLYKYGVSVLLATSTFKGALGQGVLSSAGLKAIHLTRQVGSLLPANNVKHSPSRSSDIM